MQESFTCIRAYINRTWTMSIKQTEKIRLKRNMKEMEIKSDLQDKHCVGISLPKTNN